MEEIWKDVVGYEGLYQVSNFGRVHSLNRHKLIPDGRVMFHKGQNIKLCIGKTGYYVVNLRNGIDKKCHLVKVHRLVAEAFIPNPFNLPIINHKDENKLNNRIDNLEWCTYQYNIMYGSGRNKRKETIKEKYGSWPPKIPIAKYDFNGNLIDTYESIGDAAKQNNLSPVRIGMCANGKIKSYKGFIWKKLN